jgi:phenylacetic acid degradation operon negative regulatory protein
MAVRRLDETAARIYRVRRSDWDGHWHLVVIPRQHDRSSRERWRNALCFFGYAPLSECSWISPRRSAELDALLAAEGLRAERFAARHEGDSDAMVRRLWDLDGLSRCYERWLDQAKELISGLGEEPPDERAYAVRSRLVHGWRKFLFRDPALPGALLPDGWPGTRAAELFEEESGRLWPAASRFVDVCLNPEGPHEYPDQ